MLKLHHPHYYKTTLIRVTTSQVNRRGTLKSQSENKVAVDRTTVHYSVMLVLTAVYVYSALLKIFFLIFHIFSKQLNISLCNDMYGNYSHSLSIQVLATF